MLSCHRVIIRSCSCAHRLVASTFRLSAGAFAHYGSGYWWSQGSRCWTLERHFVGLVLLLMVIPSSLWHFDSHGRLSDLTRTTTISGDIHKRIMLQDTWEASSTSITTVYSILGPPSSIQLRPLADQATTFLICTSLHVFVCSCA